MKVHNLDFIKIAALHLNMSFLLNDFNISLLWPSNSSLSNEARQIFIAHENGLIKSANLKLNRAVFQEKKIVKRFVCMPTGYKIQINA